MRRAVELTRLYATLNRPVVFYGPVGSGKTTLARESHQASGRGGALVAVSGGELSESLYADTLFGHIEGAFTGARRPRRGAYAEASAGTLLLDDLALMPKAVQASILRVLESGRYRPLGAASDTIADCRTCFATTASVDDLVGSGRLLPDLRSRLGELIITVPPLRERRGEIMLLAKRFSGRMLTEHGFGRPVAFTDEARVLLENYNWPSNVRELQAVVERATVHAGMSQTVVTIRAAHLPDRVRAFGPARQAPELSLDVVERVLRETGGNQSEAARRLGVHRNTIGRYLRSAG